MKSRHTLELDPAKDPFDSSLISDRKDIAESLDAILNTFQAPLSIAIDAPWGGGKTAFLDMWIKSNQPYATLVRVDAWSAELDLNPIACLIKELSRFIENNFSNLKTDVVGTFTALLTQIKRWRDVFNGLGKEEIAEFAEKYLKEKGVEDSLTMLSDLLKKVVSKISERGENSPAEKLIFVVDELDRCRPTFTIEMMEVVKHVFNVEGVAFIFAVDKEQLSHSIRAVYGQDFKALTYLERFFDLTIELPVRGSESYIDACIDKLFTFDEFRAATYVKREEFLKIVYKVLPSNGLNYRRQFQLLAKFAIALKLVLGRTNVKNEAHHRQTLTLFLMVVLKEHHPEAFEGVRRLPRRPVKTLATLDKYIKEHKGLLSNDSFSYFAGLLFCMQDEPAPSLIANAMKNAQTNPSQDDYMKIPIERSSDIKLVHSFGGESYDILFECSRYLDLVAAIK